MMVNGRIRKPRKTVVIPSIARRCSGETIVSASGFTVVVPTVIEGFATATVDAVAVGVGVAVVVGVCVGVGIGVAVAVGVCVGVGIDVAVAVGVCVGGCVAVGVGDAASGAGDPRATGLGTVVDVESEDF